MSWLFGRESNISQKLDVYHKPTLVRSEIADLIDKEPNEWEYDLSCYTWTLKHEKSGIKVYTNEYGGYISDIKYTAIVTINGISANYEDGEARSIYEAINRCFDFKRDERQKMAKSAIHEAIILINKRDDAGSSGT